MFKTLQKHTKAVVWILVAAFVLWGASSALISQNKATSYAGEAFGRRVSYKEYKDISDMLNIFTFSEGNAAHADDSSIWLHVVLKREAERNKIRVTDEEVRDQIRQMFGGENFDSRRYEHWVQNVLRSNTRSFEELTREFIRIQKLILSSDLQNNEVTEEEIKTRYAAENPSGKEIDEESKKEYRRKIALEKAKQRFAEWSTGLIRDARIVKY